MRNNRADDRTPQARVDWVAYPFPSQLWLRWIAVHGPPRTELETSAISRKRSRLEDRARSVGVPAPASATLARSPGRWEPPAPARLSQGAPRVAPARHRPSVRLRTPRSYRAQQSPQVCPRP